MADDDHQELEPLTPDAWMRQPGRERVTVGPAPPPARPQGRLVTQGARSSQRPHQRPSFDEMLRRRGDSVWTPIIG